jgi:hypothetical protein
MLFALEENSNEGREQIYICPDKPWYRYVGATTSTGIRTTYKGRKLERRSLA